MRLNTTLTHIREHFKNLRADVQESTRIHLVTQFRTRGSVSLRGKQEGGGIAATRQRHSIGQRERWHHQFVTTTGHRERRHPSFVSTKNSVLNLGDKRERWRKKWTCVCVTHLKLSVSSLFCSHLHTCRFLHRSNSSDVFTLKHTHT